MKKIILFALISFGLLSNSNAQSEVYTKKMKENLALLDSARTVEDYQEVAAAFERIADAEKNQWLPYYYAAFAHINTNYVGKQDADKLALTVMPLIAKAEALEKNSEIYCLKNMMLGQQMQVDPMSRWGTFGADAGKALAQAKAIDPANPRPYYLEGINTFYTPANFGGGAAKAKPILEKSVALFKTFVPKSELHPTWGQKATEKLLAQCQ